MPAPQPAVFETVTNFMALVAEADITHCTKFANGRLQLVANLVPLRRAYMSRLATGPPA